MMERKKRNVEEIQEQHAGSRQICSLCSRTWYGSLVGPCPEREGRKVCMYCCRMCGHSYLSRLGGWACRLKDQEREKVLAAKKAGKRIPDGQERPRSDDEGGLTA